jgi:hypothetical protein
MRTKRHSLFADFPQFTQAEYLETAGVGENRSRPRHEAVQPSQSPDGLNSWPQVEVIGVPEQNLNVEFFEKILRDALNRT